MGLFILEAALFVPGLLAFLIGKVPLTRRRLVQGSAARILGFVLMVPLPLYLVACKRSGVPPLGGEEESVDPLMPVTSGFVGLVAVGAAFASLLAATALACIASETRPREDHPTSPNDRPPEQPAPRPAAPPPERPPQDRSPG